jgi:hypothetical protein
MVVGLGEFLGRAGWRSRNTISMLDLHMQMQQKAQGGIAVYRKELGRE